MKQSRTQPSTVTRKVLRMVKPYKGIPAAFGKDIALLQLDKSVDFDGRLISPICLPGSNASHHSFDDANFCIATGLGHDNCILY